MREEELDSEIRDLMERADPARTPGDASLTEAHYDILERIKHDNPQQVAPARSPQRHITLVSMALAACFVLLAVLAPILFVTHPAVASPRPLEFRASIMSPEEVMGMATGLLTDDRMTHEPVRGATYTGWYLQHDVDSDDPDSSAVILPTVTELEWAEDRSARSTVRAGIAYWAESDESTIPDEVPDAGEVLSETRFETGEYTVPSTEPPAATGTGVSEALTQFGWMDDAGGFATIESIRFLLSVWTLPNAHHDALLRILLAQPDVSVLGSTVDRAGREVVGIAAENEDGLRDIVLVSASTGRIVGLETVRTTDDGDIPAGTVVSYTLWEEQQ